MIIYHGVTTYHFLCAIFHKMHYHILDDAILCVPERINEIDMIISNISQHNYFTDIIKYKELFIKEKVITEESVNTAIDKLVTFHKENFPVNITASDEIYIFLDYNSCGIYLNTQGIPYNFFEDARGRLSTENDFLEHITHMNPMTAACIKKLSLLGNSQNTTHRFGDLAAQKKNYTNAKDIHFSVSEELQNLNTEELTALTDAFGGSPHAMTTTCIDALLITQHYINIGLMKVEEQKIFYQLLVDFFMNSGKLYIKPHPSDIHGLYSSWFPDAVLLSRSIPLEILKRYFKKINTVLSASSTSVDIFKEDETTVFLFSQAIEKDFYKIFKYFIIVKLLEIYLSKEPYTIDLIGINEPLLYNLASKYVQQPDLIKNATAQQNHRILPNLLEAFFSKSYNANEPLLYNLASKYVELIKNTTTQQSQNIDEPYIVLMDLPSIYEEADLNVISNIIQKQVPELCITFDPILFLDNLKHYSSFLVIEIFIQSEVKDISKNQYIYIISNNTQLLNDASVMHIEKNLHYSKIKVATHTKDQELLSQLRGINYALEQRLKDLAEKNFNLSQKIPTGKPILSDASVMHIEKNLLHFKMKVATHAKDQELLSHLRGVNYALEQHIKNLAEMNFNLFKEILKEIPKEEPKPKFKEFQAEDNKKTISSFQKLERFIIKKTVSKRKYEKYIKNRNSFFADSKSSMIKLYAKCIK